MHDYRSLRKRYEAIGYAGIVTEALVSVAITLDKYDLTDHERDVIYTLMSEVGRERLEQLHDAVLDGDWEPFNYGNVRIGDYVRVKPDAYDSPTGIPHNGLVGKLAYMAGHRCQVKYLGEETGSTMRHPMDNLESLRMR